jgi:membrane protein DedA with SNARE-associated domain
MQRLIAAMGIGWLVHLGPVGLIVIGIVDQSFVPIPGGIDMLLIVLAAGHRTRWSLYWAFAVVGALVGAYLTYILSKKGGKEALEKKLPRRRYQQVEKAFEKHGFVALVIAALVPPPIPMVPVVVGAGALQYPTRNFLLAVGLARVVRYGLVAWFAHVYGEGIMRKFTAHKVLIIVCFSIFSVGAAVSGWLYTRYQKRKEAAEGNEQSGAARAELQRAS